MARIRAFLLCLLGLGMVLPVSAEPSVWLVSSSDPAQAEQVGRLTQELLARGISPRIVSADSDELKKFSLEDGAIRLLLVDQDNLLWSSSVDDLQLALSELEQARQPGPDSALLYSVDMKIPTRDRPLHAGESIELTVKGRQGLEVLALVGGQTLTLPEEAPGLYRGAYRVTLEDRTTAEVNLVGRWQDYEERQRVGEVELEGLAPPTLAEVRQVSPDNWVVGGLATPHSQVKLLFAIPSQVLFWGTTRHREFTAVADQNGRYQGLANLGSMSSSREAELTLSAVDAEGRQSRVVETRVKLNPIYRYQPPPPRYYYPNRAYYRGFGRGFCR